MNNCPECNGTPRTDHKLWCSKRQMREGNCPTHGTFYAITCPGCFEGLYQDEGGEA